MARHEGRTLQLSVKAWMPHHFPRAWQKQVSAKGARVQALLGERRGCKLCAILLHSATAFKNLPNRHAHKTAKVKKTTYTQFGCYGVSCSQMPVQRDLPDAVPQEGTAHHACDTDAGKYTDLRRMHLKLSTGTLFRDKECGHGMRRQRCRTLYLSVYLDAKLRQKFILQSLFRKEYGNVTSQLPLNICSAYA